MTPFKDTPMYLFPCSFAGADKQEHEAELQLHPFSDGRLHIHLSPKHTTPAGIKLDMFPQAGDQDPMNLPGGIRISFPEEPWIEAEYREKFAKLFAISQESTKK